MPSSLSAEDVNLLSSYLAHQQIHLPPPPDSQTHPLSTSIILCASALLPPIETIFHHLEHNPTLTNRLVLCGGIGHSTTHLYDAVARHPRYAHLADQIRGLPEAQVLLVLLERCFDLQRICSAGCRVLVENWSRNCGENAWLAREVLLRDKMHGGAGVCMGAGDEEGEGEGVGWEGETIVVVQDPTMARRTIASFEKAFSAEGARPPRVLSWPVFVPRVKLRGAGELVFDVEIDGVRVPEERLWSMDRFLELIGGEIPRLRDDERGYGPNGKGFIGHVDVPEEVEKAWERIMAAVGIARR